MSLTLHVTNGDAAGELLELSGVEGQVLPWRDVLHEGPVPSGLSLAEMTRARARFLAETGCGGDYEQLHASLAERDATLRSFKRFDEIVLWFEHDLYDQLQILQILNWFSLRAPLHVRLTMVCIDRFEGIENFRGLGQLEPRHFGQLYETRAEVTEDQLQLAARGWAAFTSSDPRRVVDFLNLELEALPFLDAALARHLEQFPSTRDGLSRSERQILEVLSEGPKPLDMLFRESQIAAEAQPFVGDWTFADYVTTLTAGEPLLETLDGEPPFAATRETPDWRRRVRVTDAGRKVLTGSIDRTRYQAIDRWVGGVHLEPGVAEWRWDPLTRKIRSK
ncbi:MAG: DUF1835 domain-containing protein [bacterium]|nr:DUF1835 domain-containing protein [bacterium]